MKVEIRTYITKPDYAYYPGQIIIDHPDEIEWLNAGLAVPVKSAEERATAKKPEHPEQKPAAKKQEPEVKKAPEQKKPEEHKKPEEQKKPKV